MCIAIYKPAEADMPSRRTLERCFTANPDGAGYMFSHGDRVHIRKGFTTFRAFWCDLRTTRKAHGDAIPFVLHFRISTQAGVRPDCTHPFPLSRKMDDLRALRAESDIGIAHNGIITLTSHGYNKTITYSDTMEFITEYAARLIKSREWYKDDDLRAVITALAGSKLAILDGAGTCTLLGSGWREDGGVWYSNTSYLPAAPRVHNPYTYGTGYRYYYGDNYCGWYDERTPAEPAAITATDDDGADDGDAIPFAEYYDEETKKYYFDDLTCPATVEGITKYCASCASRGACYGITES